LRKRLRSTFPPAATASLTNKELAFHTWALVVTQHLW
jgi:hypothetical protein